MLHGCKDTTTEIKLLLDWTAEQNAYSLRLSSCAVDRLLAGPVG